jgi:GNAT superfamily N-acetyltransferase
MPLFQEIVNNPSAQDLIDLQKIYSELPNTLQTPKNTDQTLEQWILKFTQQEHYQLYASCFNDRLLGAFTLDTKTQPWTLANLCVRKVTHRRGVGKALIQESIAVAKQHKQTLQAKIPTDNEACLQLFSTNGWLLNQSHPEWVLATFTP